MMIQKGNRLSVRRQSDLLELNRSGLYYKGVEDTYTVRANLIAEVYRQYLMYGYRRMQAHLKDHGYVFNRECPIYLKFKCIAEENRYMRNRVLNRQAAFPKLFHFLPMHPFVELSWHPSPNTWNVPSLIIL